MPIKPEHRHFYAGAKWKQLRARVLRRAKNCCEQCGVLNGQAYFRFVRGVWREARVVLTIAHLNHNPADNSMSNVQALCQCCHLRHDLRFHVKNARASREQKQGLLALFEPEEPKP
jgi:hypothetical protein